jgi:hypothetical protein
MVCRVISNLRDDLGCGRTWMGGPIAKAVTGSLPKKLMAAINASAQLRRGYRRRAFQCPESPNCRVHGPDLNVRFTSEACRSRAASVRAGIRPSGKFKTSAPYVDRTRRLKGNVAQKGEGRP